MFTMSEKDIELQKYEGLVIVRPPGTTDDIIETLSHVKSHRNLNDYGERLELISDKEKKVMREISDLFKRIVLFEAAAYISGTYSNELPDDVQTKVLVPEILDAQTLLSHEDFRSYLKSYMSIKTIYESLVKDRGALTVDGKVEGSYLTYLDDVLDLCHPEILQETMHVGFAGRSIDFIIYGQSTEYSKEIDSNAVFADFAKKWSHLFNPVVGYIEIASPETVDYAKDMMTRFKQNRIIMDEPEVRFKGGRGVCEQLKIAKKYWKY